MRISTAGRYASAVEGMQEQSSRLADLQTQLATQQRVNKPSDDPAAAAEAVRLQAQTSKIDANNRMIGQAQTMLQQADTAVGSATSALQDARDLMTQGATDTLSDSDRAALATQLQGMLSNLVSIANQQNGTGGYIFGGAGATTAPFDSSGTVTYQPQSGQQTTAGSLALTQDGAQAFMTNGSSTPQSVFATLQSAIDTLNDSSLTSDQRHTALMSSIDGVDAAQQRLSDVRTRIGESLNVITSQQSLNQSNSTQLQTRLSSLIDLDPAKGIADFSSTQSALQAAMASYSSIAKLSLFQYL